MPSTVNIISPCDTNGHVLVSIASIIPTANTNIFDSSGNVLNSNGSGSLDVNVTNTDFLFNLAQVGGTAISLNQKTMALSLPVTIASDQSPLSNNVTEVLGSAISLSNPLFSELSDGTNLIGVSAHPIRTDPTNTTNTFVNLFDSSGIALNSTTNALNVNVINPTLAENVTIVNPLSIDGYLQTSDVALDACISASNLNVNVTNSTLAVIQSGGWTVTANSGTDLNTSALALDSSVGTVNTNLGTIITNTTNLNNTIATTGSVVPSNSIQVAGSDGTDIRTLSTDASGVLNVNVVSFPTTNTGGVLWSAASVINTNTSNVINMTGAFKNVYTIMGSSSDAATLTVQYSPDGTNWFSSSNVINASFGSTFAIDWQTSSGYIQLIASGIITTSTISAWVNHN